MRHLATGLVALTLALAGCASGKDTAVPTAEIPSTPTAPPTQLPVVTPGTVSDGDTGRTQTDRQGSITVEVTPEDLAGGDSLAFDVSLNTHSVDLSMDLAAAAVLTTDTGRSVAAIQWDAP